MEVIGSCDDVTRVQLIETHHLNLVDIPVQNYSLGNNTRLHLETSFPGRHMHETRCYSGFWMLEVKMVFLNELDHHLDLQKNDSKRTTRYLLDTSGYISSGYQIPGYLD
ncbi:hypothetical protein B0O80DRAFT_427894 [Mortierella sp. GBAus27b]|nr:hypothetical protein B0O80DRAFT_427894 [Mortierella sp. GBAus27b]